MNQASLEAQVRPILLYNTNGFMYHVSIVDANLDNIFRPNFIQVPLHYNYDINHIFCMPWGINSLQKLFASWRDTYDI